MTYEELDELTDHLAGSLIQRGVHAETRVGVCVRRSSLLPVALMGILKAGGTYVPLIPTIPQVETSLILASAGVETLLIATSQAASCVSFDAGATLVLDRDDGWRRAPAAGPEVEVRAENLAFIMYTSGSTGTPKGISVEHRNIVNFVGWACRHYEASELEGVLFST